MLTNMISIVSGVDNERIIEDAMFPEATDESINKLIHRLKSSQPTPIEVIIVVDVFLGLLWKCSNPVGAGRLVRVEVVCSRHLHVVKKMLVPFCGDGWGECELAVFKGTFDVDIAMWCDRGHTQKERLAMADSIVQKSIRLFGKNIDCMPALVTHWLVIIALVGGVQV